MLHVGQEPFVAGLPFLRVTAVAPAISLFVLHLTQYPSVMSKLSIWGISRILLTSFNIVVIGINAKLTSFGNFQVIKLANNQIKPKLTTTNIHEIQS